MQPQRTGEDDLLAQALAGDRSALASLLEALAPQVRAKLEPMLRGEAKAQIDADDVMQVTFIEAILRIGTFKTGGVAGFVAWLQLLAERNLIDTIRAMQAQKRGGNVRRVQSRNHEESMAALIDVIAVTSTTPSRVAARGEGVRHLERALASLPPDYRTAVAMYDLDGKSIEETAGKLGRTQGATWMLRARAHERLREVMGDAGKFFSTPG